MDHCTRWPVHCSVWNTRWMRRVSRRRRVRLMLDVQGHWQCAAETGTIYDGVFTGSARRRHGLTEGLGDQDWCHVTLTRTHAAAGGCQSEWCSVDPGQALQCWYHYDFDSTRYDEHSEPFCTHSLAHHWCNCRPPVPTPGSQCAAW